LLTRLEVDMKDRLAVIAGGREGQPRLALSLVHPHERIDVALTDVLAIEALADVTFSLPDGTLKTYATPHVDVTLTPPICARLHRLTSIIVGEPMDIVVGGEVVSSPVVREPLGLQGAVSISANDMADAQALAAKLRKGWVGPNLRVV
jgi:preprotein translocase subunit SecD